MNCASRDTDLLLMAHGQLTLWQRFGICLHLGRCSACRERLRKFGAVSATLALSTRPSLALATCISPEALIRHVMLIATLWLTLIVFIIAFFVVVAPRSSGGPNQTFPRCAPDLESDRCR